MATRQGGIGLSLIETAHLWEFAGGRELFLQFRGGPSFMGIAMLLIMSWSSANMSQYLTRYTYPGNRLP